MSRYNAVLKKFGEANDDEWEAIVSVYRGDLQKPFFEHMQCLMAAAKVGCWLDGGGWNVWGFRAWSVQCASRRRPRLVGGQQAAP